tara:strand:- start:2 stop:361 length:360 start_codon:yes stop_codon:yes gene_type:complete
MKKNKNDQYTPYVIIIAIVAVVAVVSLVLNETGSVEGAVTGRELLEEYQDKCVDDDSANDYYVPGTAKLGIFAYGDHCVYSELDQVDKLQQYYCESGANVRPTKQYPCPNGCANGVCLR